MYNKGYEVKPFPSMWSATIGILELASRKHMTHAIFEIDVTEPRDPSRQYRARSGKR